MYNRDMYKKVRGLKGFTIVELLIVIVIIAILAAITLVSYSGIAARARDAKRASDIQNVQNLVELYYADHGEYPKTTDSMIVSHMVRTDANCTYGTKTSDWVPGLDQALPQSANNKSFTSGAGPGCYAYASDGQYYVLSAWGDIETGPQKTVLYRRIGFREIVGDFWDPANDGVYCNQDNVGGFGDGVYNAKYDYYKYSYTASNMPCDETPPPGA